MSVDTRQHLIAERSFLRSRLAELPGAARLTRMSTESRLAAIEQVLNEPAGRVPARVRLTFNGRPVIRSHGIFADFGTKAVSAFADAVAAVAASLTAPLAAMGPIPNREQNQLLITGTAVGSFGFELEEHGNGQLPLEEQSVVGLAIERTRQLLASSIAKDDEQLADAASDLDRRALEKVRTFVSTMAESEAFCAIQYGLHTVRFSSVGEVRDAVDRLSRDHLIEEEVELQGVFEGALPHRRSFEFTVAGQDIIVGKISPAIEHPSAINAHLGEQVAARFMRTRVGTGRPRYLLLAMPWQANILDIA